MAGAPVTGAAQGTADRNRLEPLGSVLSAARFVAPPARDQGPVPVGWGGCGMEVDATRTIRARGRTMRALQYVEIGKPPQVMEVDKPTPGPGQVLLRVTAAGACHSDEFVMSLPAEAYTYGLPLTLGHEGAGVVAELGDGVTSV